MKRAPAKKVDLLDRVIPWVDRYLRVDRSEGERIRPYFSPATYAPGELLHREGDVARRMYLCTSGLARVFYVHAHREVNLRLLSAPAAVIALASFIDRVPARESIQALTALDGLWLRLADFVEEHPGETSERILRVLAERHYLAMERRLRTLQWKSARERWAYFVEHMEPAIVKGVPGIHVASYLGVRPESLSRVRRRP